MTKKKEQEIDVLNMRINDLQAELRLAQADVRSLRERGRALTDQNEKLRENIEAQNATLAALQVPHQPLSENDFDRLIAVINGGGSADFLSGIHPMFGPITREPKPGTFNARCRATLEAVFRRRGIVGPPEPAKVPPRLEDQGGL